MGWVTGDQPGCTSPELRDMCNRIQLLRISHSAPAHRGIVHQYLNYTACTQHTWPWVPGTPSTPHSSVIQHAAAATYSCRAQLPTRACMLASAHKRTRLHHGLTICGRRWYFMARYSQPQHARLDTPMHGPHSTRSHPDVSHAKPRQARSRC